MACQQTLGATKVEASFIYNGKISGRGAPVATGVASDETAPFGTITYSINDIS